MNQQRPNRRMSIAGPGDRQFEVPGPPNRRRQTVAPHLKENSKQSSVMESTKGTGSSLELPGFANARRSALTQHDHTSASASLNTSYVSSSSSDQSTDRLNLSGFSDVPEELPKQQAYPSRPPLADRRRQTMVGIPANKRRESIAEMRRDRRRSMAPRIGQGNESDATAAVSANHQADQPEAKNSHHGEDDITGELTLPTHTIQEIMNQSSKQTEEDDFFADGPPPRQSLPFDDVIMEDPPMIQRTRPRGSSICSSRVVNTQDFNELFGLDSPAEADELDKTADEHDMKMLFGVGDDTTTMPDSSMKDVQVAKLARGQSDEVTKQSVTQDNEPLDNRVASSAKTQSHNLNTGEYCQDKSTEDNVSPERTGSPSKHSVSFRSSPTTDNVSPGNPNNGSVSFRSPQKSLQPEIIQDSPARNTRSAKKPLAEPLGISPGRQARKSPARTTRRDSTAKVDSHLKQLSGSGSENAQSRFPVDSSKKETQQISHINAEKDLPLSATKTEDGMNALLAAISIRHSLPPPSSTQYSAPKTRVRAKSMTSQAKHKNERVAKMLQSKGLVKSTEIVQTSNLLGNGLQTDLSEFSSSSMDTGGTGLASSTNDVSDSAVVPLPATMIEAIGDIDTGSRQSENHKIPSLLSHDAGNISDNGPLKTGDTKFHSENLQDKSSPLKKDSTGSRHFGNGNHEEPATSSKSTTVDDQTTPTPPKAESTEGRSELSYDTVDSDMDLEMTCDLGSFTDVDAKMKNPLHRDANSVGAGQKSWNSDRQSPKASNEKLLMNNQKETGGASVNFARDSQSRAFNDDMMQGNFSEALANKEHKAIGGLVPVSTSETSLPRRMTTDRNAAKPLGSMFLSVNSNDIDRSTLRKATRHPPRSSITPTKLTGAPARLANPLTAPTSEFKRKQAMTPSKTLLSLKRRASYDQLLSETKRPKTAGRLKSALRSRSSSLKTKKMVNFGSPEILEFDPNQSMLTPVRNMHPNEDVEKGAHNVDAGGTPFRSKEFASVNLSDKLGGEDDSTGSYSSQFREDTDALELDMNQCLDLGDGMIHMNLSGSSGSSMDTTSDSADTSANGSVDGLPKSPQIAETVVRYSMIPDASFEVGKFDGIADECEILVDEVEAKSVDLKVGELVSVGIRQAATDSSMSDVLSAFTEEARVFSDIEAVKGLLSDIIEKAKENMPPQLDLESGFPLNDCDVELVSMLQRTIRQGDKAIDRKLRVAFVSIQSFEEASWGSWVLSAGIELGRILTQRRQTIDKRIQEVESLAEAVDRQITTISKAYSFSRLEAVENKEREISCLTAEIDELEERLQRSVQISQERLQEQKNIEGILFQLKNSSAQRDTGYSEIGCSESLQNFDIASGLCKWQVLAVTDSRVMLGYTGQTSETCVNLSFDTAGSPVVASISLERSLFPAKLRFSRKFSTNVSSFMKSQMMLLQKSLGVHHLDAPSLIPGFAQRLGLRLTRIDVVAMEIRALEQRHEFQIDFTSNGSFQLSTQFPKETSVPRVVVTFLVSNEYPLAPPNVKIESFDKTLDLAPMHRLAKHVKAGYGGIVRTCDSMKAFCGGK